MQTDAPDTRICLREEENAVVLGSQQASEGLFEVFRSTSPCKLQAVELPL